MIERETPADGALVLHPLTSSHAAQRADARLEEAAGLCEALGLMVIDARAEAVRKVEPGGYFGSGKIEALGEEIRQSGAKVVVIDAALSPVQQRNLEKAWNVKVIDRTGLILEIFGERARTREGRLQVELARLTYARSRLVRTWTHLERQRGGRGFLAGPGETQIETDRRLISERMSKLRREIEDVKRTRALHRKRRDAAPWPTVALVGYTNAGKSTLFNSLTRSAVLAKDMPFATLDPTVRGVRTGSGRRILMSDTVGFITDLPTELIAAFRATLEEVREADVLIHVRDLADPDHEGRKADVEGVLDALGAGAEHGQVMIEAWNKIDRLDEEARDEVLWRARLPKKPAAPEAFAVSAVTGEGVGALLSAIDEALSAEDVMFDLAIPAGQPAALAWLHENGEILNEAVDDQSGTHHVHVRLTPADAGRFKSRFEDIVNAGETEIVG
ncbi:MAG: GTPase HflX [Pseudomonadota bacterium]